MSMKLGNRSADEVDADYKEHQTGQKEFPQLPVVLLFVPDGDEQDDHSQWAEDTSQEGVLGEVIPNHHAVKELHSHHCDEIEHEPVDQLDPGRRLSGVLLPEAFYPVHILRLSLDHLLGLCLFAHL